MGGGGLLVALGLVILWIAVTGRLSNLGNAWRVLNGDAAEGDGSAEPEAMSAAWSRMLPLPAL